MLLNSYEDAADILQYIPRKRGHHQWIFIDTDKVDIPEGTKTASFWYGDGDDFVVDLESISFFEDHVEVIGEEYIEYVRHPNWPSNVFLNREAFSSHSGGSERYLLEENVQRNNWVVNTYDYSYAMLDRSSAVDIHGSARTSLPGLALVPVECQATDHLSWHISESPSFSFSEPYPGQEQLYQIHLAGEDFGTSLNRWIYFDPRDGYAHLHKQDKGMLYVSNHPDGDYDDHREEYSHYVNTLTACIPYFRRQWWPKGVWRLAELYYVDDVNLDGPAHIPVFDDEPSASEITAFESTHAHTSGQLIDSQYRNRFNLDSALLEGNGNEFRDRDHEVTPYPWVYIKDRSTGIASLGKREASINIRVDRYSITNYSTRERVIHSDAAFDGEAQLYRYKHWPHYVWSGVWNKDELGNKVPAYGPDTFRTSCPFDESTADNPVTSEGGFAYQKWIIPTWDPAVVTTQGEGYMSVGSIDGRYTSCIRRRRDPYHINHWTESHRQYEATYFRRPGFPPGLWRRVDCFVDGNSGGHAMEMQVLRHDDEPGSADAPPPWYSSVLAEWVAGIEEQTGRRICSDPDSTSPWLKFWTPDEANEVTSSITVCIEGHRVVLPVGELQPIRGHSRGTNILDDDRNYHIARRYRSGIALAFNPCGVSYADEVEPGVLRPHPLRLILNTIEDFYLEYHDPDVVEDLVDDMYERVKIKAQGFTDLVQREQANVRTLQNQLANSARKINELLEKRSYYDSMSKGRFRHTLEANRNLLTNLGALRLEGDQLILRMHEFDIQGQPIGPLSISIDISGRTLPLFVTTEDNASHYENPHPHVDIDGRVCWGSGSDIAAQMAVGADPLEYMFWAANVLREGYQEHDAYCTIANWNEKDVWWCDHCEEEHPNDTDCPSYCSHCESHTDMDEHNRCPRHGCWDDYDSEGGDCPTCEEEAQEEQDRIDQEEQDRIDQEAEEEAAELAAELEAEEESQTPANQPEGQQEQQPPDEESAAE